MFKSNCLFVPLNNWPNTQSDTSYKKVVNFKRKIPQNFVVILHRIPTN